MNIPTNERQNNFPIDIYQFFSSMQIPSNGIPQSHHNFPFSELRPGLNLNINFPFTPYNFGSLINLPFNGNGANSLYYSVPTNRLSFSPFPVDNLINWNGTKFLYPPNSLVAENNLLQNFENNGSLQKELNPKVILNSKPAERPIISVINQCVEKQTINYGNGTKRVIDNHQEHLKQDEENKLDISEEIIKPKVTFAFKNKNSKKSRLKAILNKRRKSINETFNFPNQKNLYKEFKCMIGKNEKIIENNDDIPSNNKIEEESHQQKESNEELPPNPNVKQNENSKASMSHIILLPKQKNRRKFSNKIWRVNGKFITKEEAVKLLKIPFEYFLSNKTLQKIFHSFHNFTISALINGLTFNNFSDMLLEELSCKEQISISSPYKFGINLVKIDYKKKLIHLKIQFKAPKSKKQDSN